MRSALSYAPSRRVRAVAVSIFCVAAAAPVALAAAQRNPASTLVLSQKNVGPAYRANAGLTGARTLADIGVGDPAAVRKELARSWIGGMESAFNGVSVQWGIVSISDVFRPSARLGLILSSWGRDLVEITDGTREALPRTAPGSNGILVRGRLQGYELLIYMWQHGRTISSVDVTGKGTVPLDLLMSLVRRQDARIAAS